MGTKVQCTSYQPRFYAMGNLNEDADGCWPQYYVDTSGGNIYNSYQQRPSNGCLEFDKEMLKRTMLEHEAIFRKQVYELHRLYKIQKGMMDELKKGSCRPVQTDTSQSNSFLPQIPSECTSRMFQTTRLSETTMSSNEAPLTVTDDRKPRRMFDLQLPADTYIDCDEEERAGKEVVAESSSVNNVKLTLGINEGSNCGELCIKKASVSASTKFRGPRTSFAENQGLQFAMRSNTVFSGSPSAFLRPYGEGTSSNRFLVDDDKTSWEWPFYSNEARQSTNNLNFFSPGSSKEKFSMRSEHVHSNQKSHEIPSPDQNKRETWFKPKHEDYGRNPQLPHSLWMKPVNAFSNAPLSVPSLQCFNAASYRNGFNQGFRSDYSSASQITSQPIAFSNIDGSGLQKPEGDINLNQTPSNGCRNGLTHKINEQEKKSEDPSKKLPWVRKKPTVNASPLLELDLSKGYPQLKAMDPIHEMTQETEKNMNLFDGQTSKKIFGFSIPERIVDIEHKEKDHIDLNFDLNFDLNSSDPSAEVEMQEAPSQVSAPPVAFKIDLEAPVVLEEEKQDESLVREAAESILLISSDKCRHLDEADTLRWFAEVVSTSNEELDTFEKLTMELEEIKPEEFWCRSWQKQQNKDDDDEDGDGDNTRRNMATLLFTKPRRGQQRKRRQKRDFQRDILPGLSSLSRREVIEDLHSIGAGGLTRRRVGQKPRSLAVTVEEIHVSPLPAFPASAPKSEVELHEMEVDGRSMIGWGRTTRRCRRQRLPMATNVAAPLT
ncbi:uncharacterized protein LOC109834093 [Asparagus officinalis]|nr:uncharacterized protein LOC109834093 [Asparagus officinalis]